MNKNAKNVVTVHTALDNNKNKNNITTFDKHKPNIVGVGVPKGITDLYSHVRSNNSEMLDDPRGEATIYFL